MSVLVSAQVRCREGAMLLSVRVIHVTLPSPFSAEPPVFRCPSPASEGTLNLRFKGVCIEISVNAGGISGLYTIDALPRTTTSP